ncbi:hypothetical protein [Streptomyces sp. SID13726]|uniref:hypothetical protein n=1 Tax=Streptomyces sp. SID13726 TaxID=2706058 RepID=UPI0013BD7524|nr:hypothetical protein [Streptomyces sp. SID13726]NEB04314.1 hypothetical protein [Streptomyces sp. SID13726]
MQRYQVDLDEMDLALRQLYDLIRRLEKAESRAHYETGLARESLGTGFDEVYELYAGQAAVKTYVEDVSAHLRVFAEELAHKLKWTRDAYEDAEY